MRKVILVIFLSLILSCAKGTAEEIVVNHTQTQSDVNVTLFHNKIEILEQKIESVDRDIDRILQSSQHMWGNILTAVLAIMAILLGGSIFNTFFYVRSHLKKSEESLRNETAEKLTEIRNEFKINTDDKFNKLQEGYVTKFNKLEGKIYDAIGRVYQDSLPEVGAIWFARCIDKCMGSDISEELSKSLEIRMGWIVECFKKASKLRNPEHIAELQKIISNVDEKKYKTQKEEMKKALEENINKPEEKTG